MYIYKLHSDHTSRHPYFNKSITDIVPLTIKLTPMPSLCRCASTKALSAHRKCRPSSTILKPFTRISTADNNQERYVEHRRQSVMTSLGCQPIVCRVDSACMIHNKQSSTSTCFLHRSRYHRSRRRVAYDSRRRVAYDSRRRVAYDSRRHVAYDSRRRVAYDSRRRVAYDSRRRVAYDSRRRVAYNSRRRVAYDSRRRVTYDSRRRVAYDSRRRLAYDSRRRVAYDSRRRVAYDSRRRVAYDSGKCGEKFTFNVWKHLLCKDYAVTVQNQCY